MGGKSQTTTQNATSTPTGLPQLYDIWNRVQQTASQPYTPYGGQMVAGLSPTQQAGIAGVNAAQGSAQPYFDQAAQYAKQGASAIDPSAIQRYMSPYTQNVIDATQRQFDQSNQVQQNQIRGNAAARGALGGDRAGVAQAEAARQQKLAQDPTIAGLYSNAYTQALGAAQQDRSAAAQGAYTFGALAPSVQNAKLSGAQAQIGAGGLEQGTNQAQLTAAYNQYLQQLAFPYQQAGFLASAGLPAVGAMGGNTFGTTTKPGPSPWGQIAGLGLTAASFIKRGGRVKAPHYADGGPVGLFDIPTYIPKFGGVGTSPFSAPALPKIPDDVQGSSMPSAKQLEGGIGGIKSLFGGDATPSGFTGNTNAAFSGVPDATTSFMGGVPYPMFGAKRGGRINPRHQRFHESVSMIRHALRGGGRVHGYAGGGMIDLSPNDYVNQGFTDTRDAVDSGQFDPQGVNALGPMAFSPPVAPDVPMPRPRPVDAPQTPFALPPEIAQGPDAEPLPGDAMAFAAPQRSPYALPAPASAEAAPAADAPAKPASGLFGNPFGISDDARMGLRSAGLGMLASQSPFALSAIGEGGLQGVKTYEHRVDQRQKVESEAKRLAQAASQFAQNLGLHKDQFGETVRHNTAAEKRAADALAETRRQHDVTQLQPVKMGMDAKGRDVYGVRDPKSGSLRVIDPETGKVLEPGEGLPSVKPSNPGYINPQTGKPFDKQASEDGVIPANAQLVSSGTPYDYSSDAPYIEKGMDVPKPAPVAGKSSTSVQTDAENYLQTGKLPPLAKGRSPVAIATNDYRTAVQNYANSIAQSRGISPEQTADMWRTAPGMLRFVLGADGRATVALGATVRHLDTVQQLAKAWAANDIQAVNRVKAVLSREFGSEAGTNLEAAARIVGPEIIKALGVAGAGTEHDRNTASAQFSTASTPAQLAGAVQTVQKLLGGQLEGKKRQAALAGVSEEKFKSLMGDRAYEILSTTEKPHAPAALSARDKQALEWANANPKDPRAAEIKKRLEP